MHSGRHNWLLLVKSTVQNIIAHPVGTGSSFSPLMEVCSLSFFSAEDPEVSSSKKSGLDCLLSPSRAVGIRVSGCLVGSSPGGGPGCLVGGRRPGGGARGSINGSVEGCGPKVVPKGPPAPRMRLARGDELKNSEVCVDEEGRGRDEGGATTGGGIEGGGVSGLAGDSEDSLGV